MTGSRLRALFRLVVLIFTLCGCVLRFFFLSRRLGSKLTVRDRAEWLHQSCKRVLTRTGFQYTCRGPLPQTGLVVSNHLSHLDILFYGATLPCVFVAKAEVRRWPMFGLLASLAGTVFIERGAKASAASVAAQMQALLDEHVPVLLFPEGTSSDGSTVLRFHATLFEPAVQTRQPVTAAAIRYLPGAGLTERDLCYYGDVRFAPHLVRTLGQPAVRGEIRFAEDGSAYSDRKEAANQSWQQVVDLRASGSPAGEVNSDRAAEQPLSSR